MSCLGESVKTRAEGRLAPGALPTSRDPPQPSKWCWGPCGDGRRWPETCVTDSSVGTVWVSELRRRVS